MLNAKQILFACLLLMGCVLFFLKPTQAFTNNGIDYASFSGMPIQSAGRVKPMSSLAESSLLAISGKKDARLQDGKQLSAIEWLMDVMMRSELSDGYPVFRIDHAEVLGLFGWKKGEAKYFTFNQLKPYFEEIHQQAGKAMENAASQSPYEKQIIKLHDQLSLYFSLIHTINTAGLLDDLMFEYTNWLASIKPGMASIRAQESNENFEASEMQPFIAYADRYLELSKLTDVGVMPPRVDIDVTNNHWNNVGQGLLDTIVSRELDPVLMSYAKLTQDYRGQDVDGFNNELQVLAAHLKDAYPVKSVQAESLYNAVQPFYKSIVVYVIAFLLIALHWLLKSPTAYRLGLLCLGMAFLIHTFGLGARIYIQGRPPVTNLYSSSLFIGWGVVAMGLFLERMYRNSLAASMASVIGVCTLVIAHQLSMDGDTLEMMRAVLDSNFWLSTHVIVVTLGYSAMFLAGGLGILYVVCRLLGRGRRPVFLRDLVRMAYGVLFFALLFSFVGTMLGGVWADQSWGRFWGWDPKENGALMIVLWCAITLHAKWGKLVKDRGFMLMAIFGNVVTSWSWFGTNMLGVGLHSYGFMESAFAWLYGFIALQLVVMGLGSLNKS